MKHPSPMESLLGHNAPLPPKITSLRARLGAYEAKGLERMKPKVKLAQQPWQSAQTSLTREVF